MKLLVDEHIPCMTVNALQDMEHDVKDVRKTPKQGISDEELWEIAQQEKRLLITTDKGFSQHRHNFTHIEGFWEFWDTHSSADYEEFMESVEAEIDLSTEKTYCPIAKDVILQVRNEAKHQGVSTETLINLGLQEKLAKTA